MPAKALDQAVNERRLRPVYDAIDTGNYKKAIQEADKLLKKHPIMDCAKVLKALALIRSDRISDALGIIEDVEANLKELDKNTILTICHCYKEAYAPERICSLYERICASQPKNERSLTQLFMSYARIRNYKLQQKTAFSLYKEFPRNPYYFWGVMSVVMQASNDQKLGKTMLFSLAEKMIRKMIDADSIQAEAECDLYALVLEQSGKYEESANFLESDPLCKRFSQQPKNLLLYRVLYLHMMAKNYTIVLEKCLECIDEMSDDWNIWENMLNAAFSRIKDNDCSSEERELLVERLVGKVVSLIGSNAVFDGERRIRGPYIARLALVQKLVENGLMTPAQLSSNGLGDPLKLLLDYVHMFYALPCCFCDISVFVTLLKEEQIGIFLEKILQLLNTVRMKHVAIENCSDGKPKKPEPLKWAEILYHRMRRAVGDYNKLSPQSKRFLASELARLVHVCSDSTLASAAYAQLTAYLFWDLYTKHGDAGALFEMILFLESVQSVNTDYACRLMLCRAYALIGAVEQVQRLFQLLDIKYVQRDTLGYFLFGLLEQYGRYNAAIIFYTELTLFFDQSEKEISESIVTAYKNGSFLQIPRLIDFLNAMNHSLIATGADIENRALSACFAVDKLQHVVETLFGDEDFIDFKGVQDNRDLFAIVSFEGGNVRKLIEDEKSRSYAEQIAFMKLRHLLLKCIAAIGMPDITATNFSMLVTEFNKHWEFSRKFVDTEDCKPCTLMQASPPVYLSETLRGGDLDLLDSLLDAALKLLKLSENSYSDGSFSPDDTALCNCFPPIPDFEKVVQRVVHCSEDWKKILNLHVLIRHCSRVVRTLTLASITLKLLEALVERLYSEVIKLKKGLRKTLLSSSFNKFGGCILDGAQYVNNLLAEGQEFLSDPNNVFPEINTDCGKEMLNYLSNQRSEVQESIMKCYQCSISDLQKTIARILKPPYK